MSKEEKEALLQKARNNYPIGTKFYSCYDRKEEISEMEPYFYSGTNIAVKKEYGVIYCKNKWAEIVSLPIPNLQNCEIW